MNKISEKFILKKNIDADLKEVNYANYFNDSNIL